MTNWLGTKLVKHTSHALTCLLNLDHVPKILTANATTMMMNHELITPVVNRNHHHRVRMVGPDLLLPPELQNLPVGIRVLRRDKSGAGCRSIFRYQSTRLVTDSTCITECLWSQGASSPLWSLFRGTVKALSTWSLNGVPFLGGREVEEAGWPVARGHACALAAGFARDTDLGGVEWLGYLRGFGGNCGGWDEMKILGWEWLFHEIG